MNGCGHFKNPLDYPPETIILMQDDVAKNPYMFTSLQKNIFFSWRNQKLNFLEFQNGLKIFAMSGRRSSRKGFMVQCRDNLKRLTVVSVQRTMCKSFNVLAPPPNSPPPPTTTPSASSATFTTASTPPPSFHRRVKTAMRNQ
ncbi:hypothetical protein RIR_jg8850.t1 [Rhizophagus irregularis DAOM 181602=DAOM 197198]|uniref:Uncharacterized protein n=3 Tax=Rhizophagus irregularis TaxID=588596 RepID=U9U1B0_RHIID|nr:hypothetical protein RIR_jg8850.t1 [Rhizophagus irregularis DAOM 181602=DAOM 197198]